ncbi:MAG: hypothetical protein CL672_05520 [Balneola sp.]|nr:hypothetical protein [Balneola sp.]
MSNISPYIYLSISPISQDFVKHVDTQDSLASFLAVDQHKRLEKISTKTRKVEFLGVRSILFKLYQRYKLSQGLLPTSQADVYLTQDELGRPYLGLSKMSTRNNRETVYKKTNIEKVENATIPSVSLSHSKQWLAAVISDQSRIGIDIEIPSRMVSEALKSRFFTQQELQNDIFSDHPVWLWAIKESVVKCIGKGILADMTKVVVRMAAVNTSTKENWSINRHPSILSGQERVYTFYASHASKDWFEGRVWIHPLYVCAIAVPSLNEGGKNE